MCGSCPHVDEPHGAARPLTFLTTTFLMVPVESLERIADFRAQGKEGRGGHSSGGDRSVAILCREPIARTTYPAQGVTVTARKVTTNEPLALARVRASAHLRSDLSVTRTLS
jgi:hypothetical protein